MIKNLIAPQWVTDFLNVDNADNIEYAKQSNGTVVIRKKRIPKCVDASVLLACRDYIYKHTCDFIRTEWIFTVYFDRKKLRTTVKMTNQRTKVTKIGHAKLNASSEVYDTEIGVAIALCRAINGKHCDYQNIIGFKMA